LVTHRLPVNEGIDRTLSGFPRSARGGDMVALGLLFTPGAGCSQSTFRRCRFPCAPTCSFQPFRAPKLTKPHQGFIPIIHSNLALACTLKLALKMLRHLTLSADTALSLRIEHSEADICLNTGRERILGVLSNSPERLRVARLTIYSTSDPLHNTRDARDYMANLTDNTQIRGDYIEALLDNSMKSGCYPADLMVNSRDVGCYPALLTDNTRDDGVIQPLLPCPNVKTTMTYTHVLNRGGWADSQTEPG
jgi:hypothetical protein